MLAAACITLAFVHSLIWWGKRGARANGIFVVLAVATVFYSAGEFMAMRATTVAEYGRILRWSHLPFFFGMVALVAFVQVHLRTGRPWLAWLICGLRGFSLILNFVFTPNLNFREITSLRQVHFLGESVAIAVGPRNPWMLVGQASLLLLVVFALDATLTVWRRGDRRLPLGLICTIAFFVSLQTVESILIFWGVVPWPPTPSLFFWGIIVAMGLELAWEVIRASNLAADLQKSELRLRTILDQAPIAINISRDGLSLYANEKFKQLFGLKNSGQWLGQSILEYFAPASRPEARERIRRRTLGLPVPSEYESVGVRTDGSQFPMQLNVGHVRLADGDAKVGFVWDITERKRTEAEIRWRTAFFEAMVSASQDGILVVDNQNQKLIQNQRMTDLWKIPPDIARNPDDRLQYEFARQQTTDPAGFDEKSRRLVANADAQARDEIELLDGTVLERQTALITDPNGKEYGRLWNFHDVTASRQAAASLTRLATAVEQAAEAILITDCRGIILYVNPAFERNTGYPRAEALGQNPRILKSGRHEPALYRQLWETLLRGEVWHGRLTNRHKNGTFYEEDATISPVRDPAGKVINYVAVNRDVTREVQLEAELRQSQKLEGIGQLAGGVAHDFNNILASTLLQVSLLCTEESLSPALLDGLQQIQSDAERAANLTRQLLLFSRRQVMQPRVLNLNDQVINLVKMLTRIIGEDMEIVLQLHPAPLLTQADPGMLDQVLMNLVVNARDAMPHGGRLRIQTSPHDLAPDAPLPHLEAYPGQFVCLSVSDTGNGIPPEILPRIFEPFFTTKPEGKGTGMGLATVYGIVKQHQGWIQLLNQPGQGATFQVFLPASASPAEIVTHTLKIQAQRGTETILLVEDEPGLLLLARIVLERYGYHVLTATNGPEALSQWRQHHATVALLLTDLVMPGGWNGQELARRLQSEQPKLKIIFSSGYAGKEFQLLPGEILLQKPFGADQLLNTVRESLDA